MGKPACYSLMLSLLFKTNSMTSFHDQMGCWRLSCMVHMKISIGAMIQPLPEHYSLHVLASKEVSRNTAPGLS